MSPQPIPFPEPNCNLFVMGKNPHQSASWYQIDSLGWTGATKLQGKELSYNNLVDLEAVRRIIAEFPEEEAAAVVLKHTNPLRCSDRQNSRRCLRKSI